MELKVSYPVKINLLPGKYVVKKTPNWLRLFFVAILLSFTAFYLYTYLVTQLQITSFRNEITMLTAELTQLKDQEKKLQMIQEELNRIQKRVDILKSLIAQEPDWLRILACIGQSMPPDLCLEEASFTGATIDCRGKSQSIFSLARFIDALALHRDIFLSANFRSLTLGNDNLYNFELSLGLKTP